RTSDLGTYDAEGLAALLDHLASTDAGLAGTGYDDDALAELTASLPGYAGDGATGSLGGEPTEMGAPDQTGVLTSGFQVVVTCSDEWQQGELLERLEAEGYECRALVS